MDAEDVIDTILVTAQKREQPFMEVPLGLDVLKPETLDVLSSAGRDILFLAARSPSLYAESSNLAGYVNDPALWGLELIGRF